MEKEGWEEKKTVFDELPGRKLFKDLSEEDIEVLSRDPASFLVANAVCTRVRTTVSDLKSLFSSKNPEFEVIVDRVLTRMVESEIIEIFGDEIRIKSFNNSFSSAKKGANDYLPKVLEILARRIIKNHEEEAPNRFGDVLRWFTVPDHPKVRRQIQDLNRRYFAEMTEILQAAKNDDDVQGDQVRLSVLMTGNLLPEDF